MGAEANRLRVGADQCPMGTFAKAPSIWRMQGICSQSWQGRVSLGELNGVQGHPVPPRSYQLKVRILLSAHHAVVNIAVSFALSPKMASRPAAL
mmetsp:Transcript_5023/g.11989  ORF Transcript_5023/g.11989 Transcript_5023/m.11989 type:complete len:94 (-) Transcript_5023:1000-1281(-)